MDLRGRGQRGWPRQGWAQPAAPARHSEEIVLNNLPRLISPPLCLGNQIIPLTFVLEFVLGMLSGYVC